MSHRPLPLLVVALTAVGLVGVACTLNPQPLPPGDDRDNSATPTPTEDPSGGTSFKDGGSPPAKDAGSAPPDASADASRDGSTTDGSTDASDASVDSSTDATGD